MLADQVDRLGSQPQPSSRTRGGSHITFCNYGICHPLCAPPARPAVRHSLLAWLAYSLTRHDTAVTCTKAGCILYVLVHMLLY